MLVAAADHGLLSRENVLHAQASEEKSPAAMSTLLALLRSLASGTGNLKPKRKENNELTNSV